MNKTGKTNTETKLNNNQYLNYIINYENEFIYILIDYFGIPVKTTHENGKMCSWQVVSVERLIMIVNDLMNGQYGGLSPQTDGLTSELAVNTGLTVY